MAKPDLARVKSAVPDPMLSDMFTLEFPTIPVASGDSETLACTVQQVGGVIGKTIEEVEVSLFGFVFMHAGRSTVSHDMSVTLVENRQMKNRTQLEDWSELCRSKDTQHGSYKNEYSTVAKLTIWDQKGVTPVAVYKIHGVWPNVVPDLDLDSTGSNLITLSCSFKYDYVERVR